MFFVLLLIIYVLCSFVNYLCYSLFYFRIALFFLLQSFATFTLFRIFSCSFSFGSPPSHPSPSFHSVPLFLRSFLHFTLQLFSCFHTIPFLLLLLFFLILIFLVFFFSFFFSFFKIIFFLLSSFSPFLLLHHIPPSSISLFPHFFIHVSS